jgi:predicted amidohydrolase
MKVTIAAVQARTSLGPNSGPINLERAGAYVREAAEKGARIVCFPENFPGPWDADFVYPVADAVSRMAAAHKVYLICGDLEKTEAGAGYYNICRLFGPDGAQIGIYRRTTPEGPWIYGDPPWHFPYQTGNALPVFETEFCKIGILICSEIFVPDLSKALAMQGAEILFLPAGVTPPNYFETWGTLAKARAYENNAATVVVKNILEDEPGFCKITGPEGPLVDSAAAGVHVAEIDLGRIRWLRANEDKYYPDIPYSAKPGLLSQWRKKANLFKEYL